MTNGTTQKELLQYLRDIVEASFAFSQGIGTDHFRIDESISKLLQSQLESNNIELPVAYSVVDDLLLSDKGLSLLITKGGTGAPVAALNIQVPAQNKGDIYATITNSQDQTELTFSVNEERNISPQAELSSTKAQALLKQYMSNVPQDQNINAEKAIQRFYKNNMQNLEKESLVEQQENPEEDMKKISDSYTKAILPADQKAFNEALDMGMEDTIDLRSALHALAHANHVPSSGIADKIIGVTAQEASAQSAKETTLQQTK